MQGNQVLLVEEQVVSADRRDTPVSALALAEIVVVGVAPVCIVKSIVVVTHRIVVGAENTY